MQNSHMSQSSDLGQSDKSKCLLGRQSPFQGKSVKLAPIFWGMKDQPTLKGKYRNLECLCGFCNLTLKSETLPFLF